MQHNLCCCSNLVDCISKLWVIYCCGELDYILRINKTRIGCCSRQFLSMRQELMGLILLTVRYNSRLSERSVVTVKERKCRLPPIWCGLKTILTHLAWTRPSPAGPEAYGIFSVSEVFHLQTWQWICNGIIWDTLCCYTYLMKYLVPGQMAGFCDTLCNM